jgi:hypothetical protein
VSWEINMYLFIIYLFVVCFTALFCN